MAFAALPIRSRVNLPMHTTLPIFKGGDSAEASVLPVSIDNLIQAERESLYPNEIAFRKRNEVNAIPSSFDAAERFCNTLRNPPPAGQVLQEYNDALREFIGLLAVFACRKMLGLNVTSKEIDMSENVESGLLRGLGTQLEEQTGSRTLTYFCIDNRPFAFLYKNCIVPIKDKKRYRNALISVPFFSSTKGRFNNVLAASTDANSGIQLFKQLLYAFICGDNGMYNVNGAFLRGLGAPYLAVTERIVSAGNRIPYLEILEVGNDGNTLFDVLMNAPFCEKLPEKLFSDKLLLFRQRNHYKPPCFGEVQYDDERYNVVNPMSRELCNAVSQSEGSIVLENPDGAPDCEGSCPDLDGCITCRIRLKIDGVRIVFQKKYSVRTGCKRTDSDGNSLETVNMGIDCNINPCDDVPEIFRRYIVWNGPECVSVSFDKPLGVFPVVHLNDKAFVAIVEPDMRLPEFAFLSINKLYCGCIPFPAPIEPVNTQGSTPASIYLDFGTTNTICLVEYGENHAYVDIKEYVRMVTGEKGNAEFRIFHLLSDRDNNGTVRSMAICSVTGNQFGSPLYRAHALNAGKDALDKSVEEIIKLRNDDRQSNEKNTALDLASVNVYDNLKWTSNNLANEGYRAVIGSIFSSAFARLLQAGYNPKYSTINISVPSSMDASELELTKSRVVQALTGIRADVSVKYQHYESTAAAFFIINDPDSGVTIGNNYNVGVDIGGGSIDLFSFRARIGHQGRPIPACIDSVKNAAGRKILSETFVNAVKRYKTKTPDKSPESNVFFDCFMPGAAPPSSLNSASYNAAICITETFIPDARFDESVSGECRSMLNTFRRNVLLKTIAVLNYAAEFVKASWQKDENGNAVDFSNAEVNIILCGNGSSVWSTNWAGIVRPDRIRIRDFLKKRIGCRTLYIQPSQKPKKETVMGMRYIMNNRAVNIGAGQDAGHDLNPFEALHTPLDWNTEDIQVVQDYIKQLVEDIIAGRLLHVSGDVTNLNRFHAQLKKEINGKRLRTAIDYVLNTDDVKNKGNEIFLADVFLRVVLNLPFIDPFED